MTNQAPCDTCGEANPVDASFCQVCGAFLGWDDRKPAPGGSSAAAAPGSTPGPGGPGSGASGPTRGPDPGDSGTPPPGPATAAERSTTAPPAGPAPTAAPRHVEGAAARTEALPPARGGAQCPACGRSNDPGRRFCAHCGEVLPGAATASAAGAATRPGAEPAASRREERAARRAYRRSLPALYRWRRVLLTVAGLAGAGLLVTAMSGNPAGWLRDRWYDVRGELDLVQEVTATPLPEGSVAATYRASSVVDNEPLSAWATAWLQGTPAAGRCGAAVPGVGRIVLRWPDAVRLREIGVRGGLAASVPESSAQFRPRALDVSWDGGCRRLRLDNNGRLQRRDLDTEVDVREVTLSVADVWDPRADGPPQPLVAVSDVLLWARPR